MKTALIATALFPVAMLGFACGSQSVTEVNIEPEDAGAHTQIVRPSGRMFEIADFEAAGLKHSKDTELWDCRTQPAYRCSSGRSMGRRSSSKSDFMARTMKP